MSEALDKVFCTDCHMPQISKLVPTDFQIRSHTFRPPNPALSIAYGGHETMPNACNICHEDQTPEWAAAILGQEVPPTTDATPVPPPTPLPIPTSIPAPENEIRELEIIPIPPTGTEGQKIWLWGVGIAALAGILGAALWARRRMKPA